MSFATALAKTQHQSIKPLRVRMSYPPAFVDLIVALADQAGVKFVCAQLGLSSSTVYRWRDRSVATSASVDASLRRLGISDICSVDQTSLHILFGDENSAPTTPIFESGKRPDDVNVEIDPRAAQARVFIDAHFNTGLDCGAVAAHVGLSRFYLIRLFRSAYGITPHQYLLQVRVEAAQQLLKRSKETIEVIAVGSGFRSGGELNRAFKRVWGVPVSMIYPVPPASAP